MSKQVKAIGQHLNVESTGRDINNREMVVCRDCNTCAHEYTIEKAEADLARQPCLDNCANCNSLRDSFDAKPAVPLGGTCDTILHVCPNDGRMWWQSNTHFHLWQQVTSSSEWQALIADMANPVRDDCFM